MRTPFGPSGGDAMKKCPRCDHWHHARDTAICEPCWQDMGQMSFWQDQDDYEPGIDTVFDREEEARGYQ